MNDVIEKLPEGADVTTTFAAARDRLAERVALRMNDTRSAVRKVPPLVIALFGAGLGVVAFIVLFRFAPPAISGLELVVNVASASAVFGVIFASAVRGIAMWAELRHAERTLARERERVRRSGRKG